MVIPMHDCTQFFLLRIYRLLQIPRADIQRFCRIFFTEKSTEFSWNDNRVKKEGGFYSDLEMDTHS